MNIKLKLASVNKSFKTSKEKANSFISSLEIGHGWKVNSSKDDSEYYLSGPRNRQQIIFKANGKTIVRELQRSAKANNIAVLSN